MSNSSNDKEVQAFARRYNAIAALENKVMREQEMAIYSSDLKEASKDGAFGVKVMRAIASHNKEPEHIKQEWTEGRIALFAGGFRIAAKDGKAKEYIDEFITEEGVPIAKVREAINEQIIRSGEKAPKTFDRFEELVTSRLLGIASSQHQGSKGFLQQIVAAKQKPEDGLIQAPKHDR